MRIASITTAAVAAWTLCAAGAAAYEAEGPASWYGERHHGRKTASGERFDMHAATAAHRTLPLGSVVEVTNLDNDRTVIVRINDRGPYSGHRILDLSKGAAEQLGFIAKGTARVRIRTLEGEGAPDQAEPTGLPAEPLTYAALRGTQESEAAPAEEAATTVAAEPEPQFLVQAGTFSVRANAERAAAALKEAGPVEIRPLELRGGSFHVVVVAGGATRREADQVRAAVAAAGFADARVVSAF